MEILNLTDKDGSDKIKVMADMLRQGYTMTSDICPSCNSPLFLKNDLLYCPTCEKQVIKIADEKEAIAVFEDSMLTNLNQVIDKKIEELTQLIEKEKDHDKLNSHFHLLIVYLEAIERIKRISDLKKDKV